MIEEIYNLRKKNIKLLEELSNSKKEVLHLRNQTIEDQQNILHSIITVLDILDNNGNNENSKIILEKILEKHQVKRIATPSLMISGMCESIPPIDYKFNHKVKKILRSGYMKGDEIFRPFLVEVE